MYRFGSSTSKSHFNPKFSGSPRSSQFLGGDSDGGLVVGRGPDPLSVGLGVVGDEVIGGRLGLGVVGDEVLGGRLGLAIGKTLGVSLGDTLGKTLGGALGAAIGTALGGALGLTIGHSKQIWT